MRRTLNGEVRKHVTQVDFNLSEYTFYSQTLLKYFPKNYCPTSLQNFTAVKQRRKNYVFQFIVSCSYDHHAILQFKEITVYIHK